MKVGDLVLDTRTNNWKGQAPGIVVSVVNDTAWVYYRAHSIKLWAPIEYLEVISEGR